MNGGGVTITPASGNAVSLTKDGLNNGGNTITNVGPGVNGTDAVNVNQLKGATDGLANAINCGSGRNTTCRRSCGGYVCIETYSI